MYSWNPVTTITSIEAWDEAFTGLHGAGRISVPDHRAPWAGRLDWQLSRTYGMAFCTGGRQTLTRRSHHVRSDPRGRYELLVPLTGSALMEQGSDAAELRPGQMVICDADRPFAFSHEAGFRSIAFLVQRDDIAGRSRTAAEKPQLLTAGTGLGRIIRQSVITLQEEREQLTETAFDIACDNLLDLVCLAAEGDVAAAPRSQRHAVEADIRRHVRRHAADPDLDVTTIARELGWSVRYIQQVLQAAGTTARDLIRRERLHLARARLAGEQWSSSSIAQVAHACGFTSHAAFTTAFRQEFGSTPRDVRQA